MSSSSDSNYISTIIVRIIFSVYILTQLFSTTESLHVQGQWNSSQEFLKVVARFAVQKTDAQNIETTRGYVYGNVTTKESDSKLSKLILFVNGSIFKQIYLFYNEQFNLTSTNLSVENNKKNEFCQNIQNIIQGNANIENISEVNSYSNLNDARINNVHLVPCLRNHMCHRSHHEMIANSPYQFIYFVDTFNDSTFWYLLLLSCRPNFLQNSNHSWIVSHTKSRIDYDFWFVNGNPSNLSKFFIDFDHQFSFEEQNLIFYYGWLLCFLVLLILQICAILFKTTPHRYLNYLFTSCLLMHCFAYLFYCVHKTIFAYDGRGIEFLHISADVIKLLSTSLLMLFMLIIAKGWPTNRRKLYSRTMLFVIWVVYTIIRFILFIWIKNSVDFIEEISEHHTLPGWIGLGFRLFFMIWFIRELRHTMILEQDSRKLRFYLHFGAGMLVWFVHLPLVASIAMQLEVMSRYKIISGFSSAADVFAFGVVTRLMWQTTSKRYLNTDSDQNAEPGTFYDSIRHESVNVVNRPFSKTEYDKPNSCDTSCLA